MMLETPAITLLPQDQSSSVATRSRLSLKRRNPLFQTVFWIRTHVFQIWIHKLVFTDYDIDSDS
jgi:hypothetical protein